jgi:exopolyphosphatase/guanosine-5'-triphosphate,3'-diphosphate pyrophosphatase
VTSVGDVVAAVDCGTNSTRLLVLDGDRELERRTTITRLGRGVDAGRRLGPDAVRRTIAVLGEYGDVIRSSGATRVRAVATSAVRDATNRSDFLEPASAVLGVGVETLSGEEEGRMAFAGATAGLDPADGPFLVVDVGGGSTELILGTSQPEVVASLDIGSVRLTERWLSSDPPTAEELSMAVSFARTHVDEVVRNHPAVRDARTIVGVAGTITTIAAIELGGYDREAIHGLRLGRAQVEEVFRTVATEPLADRRHNPGLEPERADVIVGGCCAVLAVLRHLDAPGLLVSETDLLDGIARSLL